MPITVIYGLDATKSLSHSDLNIVLCILATKLFCYYCVENHFSLIFTLICWFIHSCCLFGANEREGPSVLTCHT